MLVRTLQLLAVILFIVALVGCEGDEGPMGPAGPPGQDGQDGPPGPSVILAFITFDGNQDPAVVLNSWPSGITVTIVDAATGIWDVTVDGSFPSTQGTIIFSMADTNAARSISGFITSWSTTQITFRCGVWNITSDAFQDAVISFVILGE